MRFLGVFVNFTAVNSHFLSLCRKRKLSPEAGNRRFCFLTPHLKSQTEGCSQCRIGRWQNTILDFLEAQLDFLAKFSTPPYIRPKNGNLGDSNKV